MSNTVVCRAGQGFGVVEGALGVSQRRPALPEAAPEGGIAATLQVRVMPGLRGPLPPRIWCLTYRVPAKPSARAAAAPHSSVLEEEEEDTTGDQGGRSS